MRRWVTLGLAFLALSCAPKTSQQVLRNQPPKLQLGWVLEVMTRDRLVYGAPLTGNRVLTVHHLAEGAPQAYFRGQGTRGPLMHVQSWEEKDLALYLREKPEGSLRTLTISEKPPEVGEEVYWLVHTSMGNKGMTRGWVVAVEKDYLLLDGWSHPGTSGSPVLRANGELVGIVSGGINWSCQNYWTSFMELTTKDALECLFRKSFFQAATGAIRVDGWD